MNAEFAGAGAEQISADPNVVSEVEQPVKFESFFADRIFLHVDLQLLSALLQMREPGFAHQADGHDASGNAYVDSRILQFLGGFSRVLRQNCGDGVSERILGGIGLLPKRFNLLQLLAPQFVNVLVECQWVPFDWWRRTAIINMRARFRTDKRESNAERTRAKQQSTRNIIAAI